MVWRDFYCFGGYVLSVQFSTCLWLISCYCVGLCWSCFGLGCRVRGGCFGVTCCCEFVTLLLVFGLLGVMMRNGFRFAIWVVTSCGLG